MLDKTFFYKKRNEIFISIIIITYNSSCFILDTLESIKTQSFSNFEVIICDDCSSDNTIELIQNWIEENKTGIQDIRLIVNNNNLGISANCNKGAKYARGKWIKFLAGDDILLENSLHEVSEFTSKNKCNIFASNIIYFSNTKHIDYKNRSTLENENIFNNITAKKQFENLLLKNSIPAPSVFLKNKLFQELGGFDEKIKNMEDYPFWIKVTKQGYKIHLNTKELVGYRINTNSVSNYGINNLFNGFYQTEFKYRKEHLFKYYTLKQKFTFRYNYTIQKTFHILNINNKKYTTIYRLLLNLNLTKRL